MIDARTSWELVLQTLCFAWCMLRIATPLRYRDTRVHYNEVRGDNICADYHVVHCFPFTRVLVQMLLNEPLHSRNGFVSSTPSLTNRLLVYHASWLCMSGTLPCFMLQTLRYKTLTMGTLDPSRGMLVCHEACKKGSKHGQVTRLSCQDVSPPPHVQRKPCPTNTSIRTVLF